VNKQKLFLDVDSTIIHSPKAICACYNELYKSHPDFKPALWWENTKWHMKDIMPLVNDCNDIFSLPIFFEKCEFINDNTKEIIEKLCKKYEVIICSIGTSGNIAYKSLWLKVNLPCIKEYILLVKNGKCDMDKSSIDMSGDSIFIDDVVSNLESSNAKYKICFGDTYEWNENWKGAWAINWTDIEKLLL
jgi:5'(3')-deoxyribonucleotidase